MGKTPQPRAVARDTDIGDVSPPSGELLVRDGGCACTIRSGTPAHGQPDSLPSFSNYVLALPESTPYMSETMEVDRGLNLLPSGVLRWVL
jgi:hypothetical protein